MDGRNIEPRTVLWAVAEISWEDHTGTPYRAPATLEDISVSGACIRLKTPITVGSKLTVKWQREQFFAVAKNCRSDGREFLLGVRRDTGHPSPPSKIASELASKLAQPELTSGAPKNLPALSEKAQSPAGSRRSCRSKSTGLRDGSSTGCFAPRKTERIKGGVLARFFQSMGNSG